jgi:predicted DNA-binding antitoxin AbrB/MazE fold protein
VFRTTRGQADSRARRVRLKVMRPVEASYEDGLLKPARPLQLRQGERVGIIVVRHPDPARWDLKRLAQGASEDEALAASGLDAWADALEAEDHR